MSKITTRYIKSLFKKFTHKKVKEDESDDVIFASERKCIKCHEIKNKEEYYKKQLTISHTEGEDNYPPSFW